VETVGKILLLTAAVLAVIGVVLLIAGKLGLGRLPGDIVIHRDGLTIFIPFGRRSMRATFWLLEAPASLPAHGARAPSRGVKTASPTRAGSQSA
jgi:DUF2905 family protein